MRLLAIAALLFAQPASAATIFLDFEEEAAGFGSFTSSECGCATFSWRPYNPLDDDAYLAVVDQTSIGTTDGLGIVVDYGFDLLIDFAQPVTSLSFDFGHDSAYYYLPGSEAVLHVFAEADGLIRRAPYENQLAEVRVTLNLDRLMNQSIGIRDVGSFRRAVFRFTGEDRQEPGISIDNVRFETVPEPSGIALLALASLLLLGPAGRRT